MHDLEESIFSVSTIGEFPSGLPTKRTSLRKDFSPQDVSVFEET